MTRFSAGLCGLFQQSEGPLLLYLLIGFAYRRAAMQQLRSAIHNAIARFLKNQPPARIIAVGFALLIGFMLLITAKDIWTLIAG